MKLLHLFSSFLLISQEVKERPPAENNKSTYPDIMKNTRINEVNVHKHLGLYFSRNAKWSETIEIFAEQAWKSISILRHFKISIDRKSLKRT